MGACYFNRCISGAFVVLVSAGSVPAFAQCGPGWFPAAGIPGVNGTVYASTMWDPDGAGPMPQRLVVGGTFTIAGETQASNIAQWDGVNWLALGAGITGPNVVPSVRALAVASDGSLVVGGTFEQAGETPANNVARWNGSQWQPFGAGTSGSVFAIVCEPDGGVIAGGSFVNAGGIPASRISRWDGASWSALGTGMNSNVNALGRLPSGEIVAGGIFTSADEAPVSRIAIWNGASWSALGTGFTNGVTGSPFISSIAVGPAGELVVAGNFVWSSGGRTMNGLAQWTGVEWIDVGNKPAGAERCVVFLPNGDIVRTGGHKFDGSTWTPLGTAAIPSVQTISVALSGALYFGGSFEIANDALASRVATFRDGKMQSVGTGWTGRALASAVDAQGRLLVGGDLAPANGTNAVYRWNGASWEQLGAGFPRIRKVVALAADAHDSVYAALGAGPAVSRFKSGSWQTIGFADIGEVRALLTLPGGDLVAAGSFTKMNGVPAKSIARWDGSQWTQVGEGLAGITSALLMLPNGEVIAGGREYSQATDAFDGGVARWDGHAWTGILSSPASRVFCRSVDALAVLATGELAGAGRWEQGGHYYASLARWNGSDWIAYGASHLQLVDGSVRALALLQDGGLVAGGTFRVQPSTDPASWDLVSRLPTLVSEPRNYSAPGVASLSTLPVGVLAAVGDFSDVNPSIASPGISIWTDSGRPWIASKPRARTVDAGNTLEMTAIPARAYQGVGYHWLRNGVPVQDGPGGASVGGGFVRGASGSAESPTAGYPRTLTIEDAQVSDTGQYEIVLDNSCGMASFAVAQVVRGCASDLSGDGLVDDHDFESFAIAYDLLLCSDPQMPLDCPADLTGDGVVDDEDFVSFGQAYHVMTCD